MLDPEDFCNRSWINREKEQRSTQLPLRIEKLHITWRICQCNRLYSMCPNSITYLCLSYIYHLSLLLFLYNNVLPTFLYLNIPNDSSCEFECQQNSMRFFAIYLNGHNRICWQFLGMRENRFPVDCSELFQVPFGDRYHAYWARFGADVNDFWWIAAHWRDKIEVRDMHDCEMSKLRWIVSMYSFSGSVRGAYMSSPWFIFHT